MSVVETPITTQITDGNIKNLVNLYITNNSRLPLDLRNTPITE